MADFREFLESPWFSSVEINLRGRKYYPKEFHNKGKYGVIWKGKDDFNGDVAIKVVKSEHYQDKSFNQEVIRGTKLRPYETFTRFLDVGSLQLKFPDNSSHQFVCFIEDWVEGETLFDFLNSSETINVDFIKIYIETMAEALKNLNFEGLIHDDLHLRNVKISPAAKGSLSNRLKIRIVDLGSLKSPPTTKPIDDHFWFVIHIIEIINSLVKRKRLNRNEKILLTRLEPFLKIMLDEDEHRALRKPEEIVAAFDLIWNESMYPRPGIEITLRSPFDYINAEAIPSDKLLVEMFAESCPWKEYVINPDMVVLTGPRGCGKSTIFRRMSLKGMLLKNIDEVKKSQIAGFYISCITVLSNHVYWIDTKNVADRFEEEIIHFFNLLLLREVIHTLNIIAHHEERMEIFGFGTVQEEEFFKFFTQKLQISDREQLRLQGASPLTHLQYLIDIKLDECHTCMVKNIQFENKTKNNFISDVTNFLSEKIPFFQNKKIVFFIDDLSSRVIPKNVQIVLNAVIFARPSHHIFKISSDRYGWEAAEETTVIEKYREFIEIDCGSYYLNSKKDVKIKFTKDILYNRLNLCKYEGTPEEIIGKSIYNRKTLGMEIRYRVNKPNEKRNDLYHGLDTISKLCCGDISVLLDVFRKIFIIGNVRPDTHTQVSPNHQHQAILAVSREFHDYIRNYRPHGADMYSIADNFGKLSRRILHEGKPHVIKGKVSYPQTT